MRVHRHRSRGQAAVLGSVLALLAGGPGRAAALPLLEAELTLEPGRPLLLAMAAPPPADPSLDFDLLGKAAPPQVRIDDAQLKRRRSMLQAHQAIGLGLFALQLATTVAGQLNYSDKYGSNPPVTGRYELSHSVLAYSTLGIFAVDGAIALLAPSAPPRKSEGIDRVTIHRIGMAAATAGMLAQGVVGIYTDRREGYLDQASAARTHLAIGYATLAVVCVAVGVLVF